MDNYVESKIEGVILTPLKIIPTLGGDVLHGIKAGEVGYAGFGEAYFSNIQTGKVKPWKRHKKMTLNIIVPIGAIRFVLFDDRLGSLSFGIFEEHKLSLKNFIRLTIPPMIWVAFQGLGIGQNLLLNVADLSHEPNESDRRAISEFSYKW